jgi:hypothetical protein
MVKAIISMIEYLIITAIPFKKNILETVTLRA